MYLHLTYFFFFFNDTATTEIYTLSLHDALPICLQAHLAQRLVDLQGAGPPLGSLPRQRHRRPLGWLQRRRRRRRPPVQDRKSTRLNSSHANISYAVFCLKKKKIISIYLLSILKR